MWPNEQKMIVNMLKWLLITNSDKTYVCAKISERRQRLSNFSQLNIRTFWDTSAIFSYEKNAVEGGEQENLQENL